MRELRPDCRRCGGLIVTSAAGNRYCPECNKKHIMRYRLAIRERESKIMRVPVKVTGARKRLREFVNAHPDYTVSVVLSLLTDRQSWGIAA